MVQLPQSSQPVSSPPASSRTVIVCQNRACCKAGAAAVLAKLRQNLAELGDAQNITPVDLPNAAVNLPRITDPVTDITVIGCHCLGQCGNGPMVLVMPERVWYHRVHPDEVPAIVQQHLQQGKWLKGLLYPKFHSC
jgi:(2Fe-2S) ferredoxin